MQQKRFYNLDGMRFFAAALVIVSHLEEFKKQLALPYIEVPFTEYAGTLGVRFFFVLSGFLITWKLASEKQKNPQQRIDLVRFYRNRSLRIWPLYYVYVLLTLFVFQYVPALQYGHYNSHYFPQTQGIILFALMMPNTAELFNHPVLYNAHFWSLGVEEFFYLFFPLVIYFIPYKNLVKVIALLLIVYAIIGFSLRQNNANNILSFYVLRYQLTAFFMGSLAALAYVKFHTKPFINIYKKQIEIACSFVLLVVVYFVLFPIIKTNNSLFYMLLFALLLLLMALSQMRFWVLNQPVIVYLGKISFGIYVFHQVGIKLGSKVFTVTTGYHLPDTILHYLIVLLITVSLASISYFVLEKPFLNLKKKNIKKAVSL